MVVFQFLADNKRYINNTLLNIIVIMLIHHNNRRIALIIGIDLLCLFNDVIHLPCLYRTRLRNNFNTLMILIRRRNRGDTTIFKSFNTVVK